MSDDKDDDILNLYETLPKKFKEEERHYDSEKQVNIKLPFMMCVTGATGSGKTNAIINIVRKIGAFDKIMLWAKNTDEPIYASFIEQLREAEKKTGTSILSVSNTIDDLPDVKTINKENTTLLIIDDMVTEKDKSLAKVAEYWIRGRKQHCSCMFLSQSYFRIPKIIRDNSFYFIFSKITGDRDLQLILKDYKLGVTDDQLVALYDKATAGGFPNFFMIDVKTSDKNLRFRRNLKGMSAPELSAKEEKSAEKGGPVHKGDKGDKGRPPIPSASDRPRNKGKFGDMDPKDLSDFLSNTKRQPKSVQQLKEEKDKRDFEHKVNNDMNQRQAEKEEAILKKKKDSEDSKMDAAYERLKKKQESEEKKEAARQMKEEERMHKEHAKQQREYLKEYEREMKRQQQEDSKHPFNQPTHMERDNPDHWERDGHKYEGKYYHPFSESMADMDPKTMKRFSYGQVYKPKMDEDDPYDVYEESMGTGFKNKKRKKPSSSKSRKRKSPLDSELEALIQLVQ